MIEMTMLALGICGMARTATDVNSLDEKKVKKTNSDKP